MKRRHFMAGLAAGLATANITRLSAEEMPKLTEDDPQATALKYKHDADSIDASVRPEGRYCNNCQLYQGGADAEWAPCQIFAGKVVAGKGWCSVWAPKAG